MEHLKLDYSVIYPEVIVTVVGILIMLVDAYTPSNRRRMTSAGLALVGLVAAILWTGWVWYDKFPGGGNISFREESWAGMIVTDPMRMIFVVIALLVSALTVLSSMNWLEEDDLPPGEFYVLLMFATVGMMLMAGAADLVVVFLGLEILSIATYVMAGFRRRDLRSNESALKYYILGSFATGFLLYGMALVYGATGTTSIAGIRLAVAGGVDWSGMLLGGAALMLVGLGFKVAVAPFHVWTPDVYEGAPSVVTGWMSTGPKAAAFAAFVRIFVLGFAIAGPLSGDLQSASIGLLSSIAALTMIFGNVVAMVQNNIKRMLAYSSIAHAGYAMVGMLAGDWQSVAFYMLAYAAMNVGAFAVVSTIARRADRAVTIEDYRGIGFDNAELSVALAIFLISLAGFPLTAGFMGKLLVFKAAWGAGLHALVVIGVLASAASVYYYFRPIVAMFFGSAPEGREPARLTVPGPTSVALMLCQVLVLILGVLPDRALAYLYPPRQQPQATVAPVRPVR